MDKLAQLIPSVYYDVIARILPGGLTILAVMWALGRDIPTNLDLKPELLISLVLIAVVYVAGMLLTTAGVIFDLAGWIVVLLYPPAGKLESEALWTKIDRVAKSDPANGAVLAKMAAEVTLAQNLFFGSVLVWAVDRRGHRVLVALIALFLLGTVVFRLFVLRRRIRTMERA